jgi:hypothetical protein
MQRATEFRLTSTHHMTTALIRQRKNDRQRMNTNNVTKVQTALSKLGADAVKRREQPRTMELCLLSAFNANSLPASLVAAVDTSSTTQSSANRKRSHSPSIQSENKSNVLKKNFSGGKKSSISPSLQSRLQWLQDHGIMHNVLFFLDESDLFQLENAHSEMIGPLSIARQWSYLSISDENKTIYAQKRWRAMDEKDVEAVVDAMKSNGSEAVDPRYDDNCKRKDSGCDITMIGQPCKKELLARQIGRHFASEALFVKEREKEASHIYNFDRTPADVDDIPLLIDSDSSTDHEKRSNPTMPSSQVASDGGRHWCEWYDYRANSVNEKNAFVRLSLRDGSGRFWHGFRRLTTNYNKTFFRLHFNMKELIKDMRWTEFESYLTFNDTTYTSMQSRLKAMEALMRMTQLTVSLGGKLLVATGGYSPSFGSFPGNGKCYFHARHYRLPLAETTKNELQWMPYRICLADDSAQNELVVQFDCDHPDLPFMKAEDIGNPNAFAHW